MKIYFDLSNVYIEDYIYLIVDKYINNVFFDQLNFNKLKITHLILKETLLIKSVFIIILENPSTLFSVVKL